MPRPSPHRAPLLALVLFAVALAAAPPARAQNWLPGFDLQNPAPTASFNLPTQVAFLPDGRWLVAEKAGVVWILTGGVKSAKPLWDGQAEVLDPFDRGLLSIAVDPNYFVNHYVYFLYTVDPDSNNTDTSPIGFGRLTRYQVSFTDSTKLVTGSRTILMGTGWSDSPLELSTTHSIGTLRFARDGTLLVSSGEGARFDQVDNGGLTPQAFAPGMAPPAEDIGAFRAQDVNSLNGKILRLDPATGHGVASNPFWDGDGTHKRSKVWCYGLRNPFRFTIKPGTGSTNPAAGQPGELYIGDVGWNSFEEVNVSKTGGENFGWPCREGRIANWEYEDPVDVARGWCDSLGSAANPALAFTEPILAMHHDSPALATVPGLTSQCVAGIQFYTGTLYPPAYRNQLFLDDFALSWLHMVGRDSSGDAVALPWFADQLLGPVDLESEPGTGNLIYVSILQGQLHRFAAVPSGDLPPTAVATASALKGIAPFTTTLLSTGTLDPENEALAYHWDFGDGGTSTQPSLVHTYALPGDYVATLSVDDGHGNTDSATVNLHAMPSAAFPLTGILDGFQRADGPVGNGWTGDVGGVGIAGGRMASDGSPAGVAFGSSVFGASQEAYANFATVDGTPAMYDLLLKQQGPSWTDGVMRVRHDGELGGLRVESFDNGTGWITRSDLIPCPLASGDQLGARLDASGVLAIYRNQTRVATLDVSAWSAAAAGGYVGLGFEGAPGAAVESFGGGDASAADTVTAVGGGPATGAIALSAPRPNPTRGVVDLTLELPRSADVRVQVTDVLGRLIWEAPPRALGAGRWALRWDGRTRAGAPAPAGLYLVRVRAGDTALLRRVALVR